MFIFLIPLPLFFAQTVYSEKGYTAWVAIGIAWVFCSIVTVVIYPVFESRHALIQITRGIYIVSHIFCGRPRQRSKIPTGPFHEEERQVCIRKNSTGRLSTTMISPFALKYFKCIIDDLCILTRCTRRRPWHWELGISPLKLST